MAAAHAFSKLYRACSDGKLLQVVRRRDFPPVSTKEMQQLRLRESQVASSPLVQEIGDVEQLRSTQERFKHPYWKHCPKQRPPFTPFKKPKMQKLLTHSDSQSLRPIKTPAIPVDTYVPKPIIIQPQVKVMKKILGTENLEETGRALGFDTSRGNFAERFHAFSTSLNEGKTGRTTTRSAKTARPQVQFPTIRKGLTHRESIDNHSSGKVFDPEEFRRERMLTEQAKALFMSGAFSKLYNKEREDSDKEMMAWIKYY